MRPILAVLLLCSAFSLVFAQTARAQAPSDAVARGKALTETADCGGCHTVDPAKPFAGGKRIETPFGAIYSPNLTPDRDTGIGKWSDDDFYRALHLGIAPSGSRYYPAFPYPNFSRMTRDDVLAIRAYLATLAPVHNTRPPAELRWPYRYRVLMRAWDWLFFHPHTFTPHPNKSAEWNRGAYLVEGLAHCGACHNPAQCARRRAAERDLRRRRRRSLAGVCDQRAVTGAGAVERRRAICLFARWRPSRSWHRTRADGRSGAQSFGRAGA